MADEPAPGGIVQCSSDAVLRFAEAESECELFLKPDNSKRTISMAYEQLRKPGESDA